MITQAPEHSFPPNPKALKDLFHTPYRSLCVALWLLQDPAFGTPTPRVVSKAGSMFCSISVTLPGSGCSLAGHLRVCTKEMKEHTHLQPKTC